VGDGISFEIANNLVAVVFGRLWNYSFSHFNAASLMAVLDIINPIGDES